ncbi:MAG TPA: ribonucleotide reductase N-terminal alpha domain-containing protein, partial [Luteitalea sp.]|nr:ribonucleotide reductase N-terminal alpha domain-containing protein [Luteitalea sp.]
MPGSIVTAPSSVPAPPASTSELRVIKRSGATGTWDPSKISTAIARAFLAVEGPTATGSTRIHDVVAELTTTVTGALERRAAGARALHIEDIQDQVELSLMRAGHHKVARAYVLYREARADARRSREVAPPVLPPLTVRRPDGSHVPLDDVAWRRGIALACEGLPDVSVDRLHADARRNVYDGIPEHDLRLATVMAARVLIDVDPDYTYVAARLLLEDLTAEATAFVMGEPRTADVTGDYFPAFIHKGVALGLLAPDLSSFDLARLAAALQPARDRRFQFLGLQTLYDRYVLHHDGTRFELPQAFFMRVAMGLALREDDREARAIEFYDLLSSFDFMCSTPTLFNAGTQRPQLSSCFLTTVPDELDGIFGAVRDNALLSKYAGGLGNDWTRVRGLGARIRGTNGESQGIVPFLKVANDTAIAVNQGGKRAGAVCAYLEPWHIDVEEFLDLRKNTGDERRRTHDMNTANWIP